MQYSPGVLTHGVAGLALFVTARFAALMFTVHLVLELHQASAHLLSAPPLFWSLPYVFLCAFSCFITTESWHFLWARYVTASFFILCISTSLLVFLHFLSRILLSLFLCCMILTASAFCRLFPNGVQVVSNVYAVATFPFVPFICVVCILPPPQSLNAQTFISCFFCMFFSVLCLCFIQQLRCFGVQGGNDVSLG